MDHHTYTVLRGYCWQELSTYLEKPAGEAKVSLMAALHGPTGELRAEKEQAEALYHARDLTPRERAACHLLAVISNHRAIAWVREDGSVSALSAEETDALQKQTREAVKAYAAHISDRESSALISQAGETEEDEGSAQKRGKKTAATQRFDGEVLRLMDKFWNERGAGSNPTKQDLHKQVFAEMHRSRVLGAHGGLTEGMVRDSAKPWKKPLVVPTSLPQARFAEKRHPFKGAK